MKWSRENRWRIAVVVVGLAFTLFAPGVLQLFTIINLTTAIALAILALSLGLIWGYGGILCFGQTAFFGIGAYAYTIAAINFGGTTWAILVAVLAAAAFAAALGYFVFYGRVSDVYMAVITLTVTLIIYFLMLRTSGPKYKIGDALLGGFNGITSPPLNLPWPPYSILFPQHLFYVGMIALILGYIFCAWLVQTHFGRVSVAIRENEVRTELLGYDTRAYKLALFTIGGALAGIGGILFCNGIGRVTPDVFRLDFSAQVIIWVIVGGRGTLLGPVLASFALFYLNSWLGTQTTVNTFLVLGIILIAFVLGVPRGLLPTVVGWWDAGRSRRIMQRREMRLRRRRAGRSSETAEAANEG